MPRCRSCGRSIIWVETINGNAAPCDYPAKPYITGQGLLNDKIVTTKGVVLFGTFIDRTMPAHIEPDGYGYVSHFATCPYGTQFRHAETHRKKHKENDGKLEQISLL